MLWLSLVAYSSAAAFDAAPRVQDLNGTVVFSQGLGGVPNYNNNDALLSQIWVIAKATVLEVCTVPHVEPSVDELLTAAQLDAFCEPV
jgi:hypothetical protein